MSRFAPVCPIRMYKELKETDSQAFGDYFLLLAHDVIDKPKEYAEVFHNEQYTIIMDNSVIELGESVEPEVLIAACEIVGASVLAIPDVLEDGEATFNSAVAFMDSWYRIPFEDRLDIELMFIPQGEDIADYVRCINNAVNYGIPMDWVGIARNITGRIAPTRMDIIGFLSILSPKSKLHLLGFSTNIQDDIKCAKHSNIQGIDSAVPVRTDDKYYPVNDVKNWKDPGSRGDWWEKGTLTKIQRDNIYQARHAIREK